MIDFDHSPIAIPEQFRYVPYKGNCYPGSPHLTTLKNGANCQVFAYEFIRYYGCKIPDFRSSNLWEDNEYTKHITELMPLDLVSWGAHVGVYLGDNLVIHLSKALGLPAIEKIDVLLQKPDYICFLGAKRCI
jgi:murein DD-endopeptidase / murein LD-carboxypeptidase